MSGEVVRGFEPWRRSCPACGTAWSIVKPGVVRFACDCAPELMESARVLRGLLDQVAGEIDAKIAADLGAGAQVRAGGVPGDTPSGSAWFDPSGFS